jgi:hypothetical protein
MGNVYAIVVNRNNKKSACEIRQKLCAVRVSEKVCKSSKWTKTFGRQKLHLSI